MAKGNLKLQQKDEVFYSLSEVSCLPAPSSTKPEKREFEGDSGASMHMLSRKDLNSAELETIRASQNATTDFTASGEVQPNEEATLYVHDLELFVTLQILDDTPAVPSLGKLCEEHGCTHEWASGQKHIFSKSDRQYNATWKMTCRSLSWIINQFFLFDCKYISNIVTTGLNSRRFYAKSSTHTT